jgi:catechol 2,3-dioxygenase-like lactoylglutathione lyase family enzyme
VTTPIKPRISGVFVPVRDIEKARDWYNRILGLEGGEILFGHLYCPVMDGPGLMLDAKAATSFDGKDDFPTYRVPAFMFATDDINAAYQFMRDNGVELFTGIEHDKWFVFKDPDGNLLMVCA